MTSSDATAAKAGTAELSADVRALSLGSALQPARAVLAQRVATTILCLYSAVDVMGVTTIYLARHGFR